MRQRMQLILISILAAVVFLGGLGQRDIITSHEARVAQTAREMAITGWPWAAQQVAVPRAALVDTPEGRRLKAQYDQPPLLVNAWGVPVLNGEIRLQKPPLPYWCSAIAYRIFGMSEATARLPSALLGVVATLIVFDLGRRLIGRSGGWMAALVWLSSYFVIDEMRKAMADPYLAAFCLAALWAWVRAAQAKGSSRGWLVVAYVALGLSMLSKGPVGIIHAAVPIAAYHLCYRRPMPRGLLGHVAGVAVMLAIVLPWPVYVMRNVPNAMQLWRYESLGEFTGENTEKARGWFFYIPQLFQLSLPWIVVWAAGMVFPVTRLSASQSPRRRRAIMPIAWYLAIVIAFSFSSVKKNAYLLPMMPAQAMLIAQFLRSMLALGRRTRHRWVLNLVKGQAVIGVLAGIAITYLVMARPTHFGVSLKEAIQIILRPSPALAPGIVAVGLIAIAATVAPVAFGARPTRRWVAAQAIAFAAMIFLFLNFFEASYANVRSPKAFMAEARDEFVCRPGYVLSRHRMQEAALFYLDWPAGDLRSTPNAQGVLVILEDRRSSRGMPLGPDYFAPDVPGRRIVSISLIPLRTSSERNRWRLYELTVEQQNPE